MIIKKLEQGNHVWEFLDDNTRKCELILTFPEYGCPSVTARSALITLHLFKTASVTKVYSETGKEIKSDLDFSHSLFDTRAKGFLDLADKIAKSLANIIMMEMEIIKICEEVRRVCKDDIESISEILISTLSQEVENLNFRKSQYTEIKDDVVSSLNKVRLSKNEFDVLVCSIYNSGDAEKIYRDIYWDCSDALNAYIDYQKKVQDLVTIEQKTYLRMSKAIEEINKVIDRNESAKQKSLPVPLGSLSNNQESKRDLESALPRVKPDNVVPLQSISSEFHFPSSSHDEKEAMSAMKAKIAADFVAQLPRPSIDIAAMSKSKNTDSEKFTAEQLKAHQKAVDDSISLVVAPEWKLPDELINLANKYPSPTIARIASRVNELTKETEEKLAKIKAFEDDMKVRWPTLKIFSETVVTLNIDLERDVNLNDLFSRGKELQKQRREMISSVGLNSLIYAINPFVSECVAVR